MQKSSAIGSGGSSTVLTTGSVRRRISARLVGSGGSTVPAQVQGPYANWRGILLTSSEP